VTPPPTTTSAAAQHQHLNNNIFGNRPQSKLPTPKSTAPLRHNRYAPASRARNHNIGNSALPPLPPALNSRSHSLDGLLNSAVNDTLSNSMMKLSGEGLNEKHNNSKMKCDSNDSTKLNDSKELLKSKAKNRRSKSLDDLIDEDDDDDMLLIVDDECDRETQSMENILGSNSPPITQLITASNNSLNIEPTISPVPSEKMCENEVITVNDNSLLSPKHDSLDYEQDDSGICLTPKLQSDTSSLDEDAISNTISITSSTASERKSGKTFLNKYVKKVKNLMKK
jgi:hypothetical protein